MNDLSLPSDDRSPFDAIRREDVAGERIDLLRYDSWRRFEETIERATIAANNAGLQAPDHIADAVKMIEAGNDALRAVTDYRLSRFGAHSVTTNGDPRKPEIAEAQTNFAARNREAEFAKPALTEDQIVHRAFQTISGRI